MNGTRFSTSASMQITQVSVHNLFFFCFVGRNSGDFNSVFSSLVVRFFAYKSAIRVICIMSFSVFV